MTAQPAFEPGAPSGQRMYELIRRLYPICRSITGEGVRETLRILGEHVHLEVREVPSGTQVLDWTIPLEWNIRDAYVADTTGRRVIDFRAHNLHVMSYSRPVRGRMTRAELDEHLSSLPDLPDAIPYRTTYYADNWGFCLRHRDREALTDEYYDVEIDATLAEGSLTYGELYLPGERSEEILFSTHICHPSMCNDNLSAIVVAAFLARELGKRERRYSYRFLFTPGAIGSIAWLALNEAQSDRIAHGLVLASLGDEGTPTYKRSRRGNAEIDEAVALTLRSRSESPDIREFTPYGYDERQFCSPGFNLPVGRLTRTPNGEYPEYHTSADDLDFVSAHALDDSLKLLLEIVDVLERDDVYVNLSPKGEPQLGRRGLYGGVGGASATRTSELALLWVLSLSDGTNSLVQIAARSGIPFGEVAAAATALEEVALLERRP
jgi:aminopeptidase-like protein